MLAVELGIRPLIESEDLSERDLRALVDDLSRLLETEPALPDTVNGEREVLGLQGFLPFLKEPGWVPPGGVDPLWRREDGTLSDDGATLADKVLNWINHGAVLADKVRNWIIYDAVYRRSSQACTAEMRPSECLDALDRLVRDVKTAYPLSDREMTRWCQEIEHDREWDRETAIAHRLVCLLDCSRHLRMLAGTARVPFYLAAARLQARMSLERLRTGRCPPAVDLLSSGWAQWTLDPLTGRPMQVVEEAPGLWLVQPDPAGHWLPPYEEPYRFACLDQPR